MQAPGLTKDSLNTVGGSEMDDLDAMEMDESSTPSQPVQSPQHNFQPQPQFGRQQPRVPTLNTHVANAVQAHQASQPSTPQPSQNFNLQHNPTVSSVNTPTFGQTTSQLNRNPGDLDIDYGNVDTPRAGQGEGFDFAGLNIGMETSGTIDDPAKRLLSRQGFGAQKSPLTTSPSANTSELAKRLREQQLLSGGFSGIGGFGTEEPKPFRCPVIGCEKAYKNQNGLKYHKQVSCTPNNVATCQI